MFIMRLTPPRTTSSVVGAAFFLERSMSLLTTSISSAWAYSPRSLLGLVCVRCIYRTDDSSASTAYCALPRLTYWTNSSWSLPWKPTPIIRHRIDTPFSRCVCPFCVATCSYSSTLTYVEPSKVSKDLRLPSYWRQYLARSASAALSSSRIRGESVASATFATSSSVRSPYATHRSCLFKPLSSRGVSSRC